MRLVACLMIVLIASAARGNVLPIITNVSAERTGESISIRYDVTDPDGHDLAVVLIVPGTELRFEAPGDGVTGDLGPGVTSGVGREITIDAGAVALPDPLVPRLLAHDGRGYGSEMIAVASTTGPDFLIGRYEITNEEFAAFVRADGYEFMEYWVVDDGSIEIEETGWNYCGSFHWAAPRHWDLTVDPPWSADLKSPRPDTPVLGLSWFEAYAYCRWSGRRLPIGSEWREAAGVLRSVYPWGDEPTEGTRVPRYDLANVRFDYKGYDYDGLTTDGFEYAAPVGSFSPRGDSPLGLADAIGNVWEWCQDPVAVVEHATYSCATRLLIGGSWATGIPDLEKEPKDLCPLYRPDTAGFRCCMLAR